MTPDATAATRPWLGIKFPRQAVPAAFFALMVTAAWLIQHPYAGFEHDARIYLLLVLDHLRPEIYSSDILVAYGSQGRYTSYPTIAAAVTRLLGDPSRAMFAVWVVSYAIFVAGVVALSRTLVAKPLHLLAVALVLVLPADYGVAGYLSYGEAIATPRPAAEGLVLAALALWSSDRQISSVALIALALLVHPLVAVAGIVAIVSIAIRGTRARFVPLLGLGSLALLLALADVSSPWPLATLDPGWMEVVRLRVPYLFPDTWSLEEWGRVLLPIGWSMLGLLACGRGSRLESLLWASLVTAMLGLAVALATTLVPNVTLIEVQPWRWVWVTKVVSIISLPIVASRIWNAGPAGRTVAALAAAAWVTQDTGGWMLLVLAMLVWILRRHGTARSWKTALLASSILLALFVAREIVLAMMEAHATLPFTSMEGAPSWIRSFAFSGIVPAVAVSLGWYLAFRKKATAPVAAMAIVLAVTAAPAAIALPASIAATPAPDFAAAWQRVIPQAATVYWPGSPVKTWLALERTSYISEAQGTAALFSREAAFELTRRSQFADALNPGTSVLDWEHAPKGRYEFSDESVAAACADEALDFLVVPVDAGPIVAVTAHAGTVPEGPSLVDCAQIRASGRSSP